MLWKPTDLDVVFADTGEPNADENLAALAHGCWRQPIRIEPGCEADAPKEAARAARTPRFFLVTGDQRADPAALSAEPISDGGVSGLVAVFGATNAVNGLPEHEAGPSCWSREAALSGTPTAVRYVRRVAAERHFNTDPLSAFFGGYREAARLALDPQDADDHFENRWVRMNSVTRSRLLVWLAVGADRPHGLWAIVGARRAMVDLWVQRTASAEEAETRAHAESRFARLSAQDPAGCAARLGHILRPIGLEIPALRGEHCDFFRHVSRVSERADFA